MARPEIRSAVPLLPAGGEFDMTGTNGAPGPVSRFAEADYCYGVGPLTIRIERIDWAAPVLYDGENWYEVYGVEIGTNGTVVGHRQALVRGRRLPPPPAAVRRR